MSSLSKLACASLFLGLFFVTTAAHAAGGRFYYVNLNNDLQSPKPLVQDAVTFDDDMEFLPDGVEFVLPKSLLRSYAQVRVIRQEGAECKVVNAWQTSKKIHYRVTTSLGWDEPGCDVEILVQTARGLKRIVYTLQQIGS